MSDPSEAFDSSFELAAVGICLAVMLLCAILLWRDIQIGAMVTPSGIVISHRFRVHKFPASSLQEVIRKTRDSGGDIIVVVYQDIHGRRVEIAREADCDLSYPDQFENALKSLLS